MISWMSIYCLNSCGIMIRGSFSGSIPLVWENSSISANSINYSYSTLLWRVKPFSTLLPVSMENTSTTKTTNTYLSVSAVGTDWLEKWSTSTPLTASISAHTCYHLASSHSLVTGPTKHNGQAGCYLKMEITWLYHTNGTLWWISTLLSCIICRLMAIWYSIAAEITVLVLISFGLIRAKYGLDLMLLLSSITPTSRSKIPPMTHILN